MNITLYTFLYNEQEILPYFLKHYSQYVNKIVVYDNNSTDRSIQILNDWKDCEIEIREYNTNNQYDERSIIQLKNNCWKDDTSDYIIVCDVDELLYHPNLIEFIEKQPFTDYYTPQGFHMMGEEIPTDYTKQIYDIIKIGSRDDQYDKNVLFKRKNITETNYSPGCHASRFKGESNLMNYSGLELKLLHYKWLSFEYVYEKHTHYSTRISNHSKSHKYGQHYTMGRDWMKRTYDDLKNKAKQII
jgi:glycosyltransferase involved in cell wall biosynthesis